MIYHWPGWFFVPPEHHKCFTRTWQILWLCQVCRATCERFILLMFYNVFKSSTWCMTTQRCWSASASSSFVIVTTTTTTIIIIIIIIVIIISIIIIIIIIIITITIIQDLSVSYCTLECSSCSSMFKQLPSTCLSQTWSFAGLPEMMSWQVLLIFSKRLLWTPAHLQIAQLSQCIPYLFIGMDCLVGIRMECAIKIQRQVLLSLWHEKMGSVPYFG